MDESERALKHFRVHTLAALLSIGISCAPPALALQGPEAASQSPTDELTAPQLVRQGNELLRQEKLEQARESYRKALGLRPDSAEAHYGIAAVSTAQQKVAEAM